MGLAKNAESLIGDPVSGVGSADRGVRFLKDQRTRRSSRSPSCSAKTGTGGNRSQACLRVGAVTAVVRRLALLSGCSSVGRRVATTRTFRCSALAFASQPSSASDCAVGGVAMSFARCESLSPGSSGARRRWSGPRRERSRSDEETEMPEHKIATREEWQAARHELARLEAEHAERNEVSSTSTTAT